MDMLESDCIMVIMNRVAVALRESFVATMQKAKIVASGMKQVKYVHHRHVVLDAGESSTLFKPPEIRVEIKTFPYKKNFGNNHS